MAKDPAFLFYSSDFMTGTALFNNEQKGKYITLLCLQHQTGHLGEESMLEVCKTYDKHIFSKFVKDENGLYFNERLENETIKRKAYSKSRAENRKKKNISNTYVPHMENENGFIGNEGIGNTMLISGEKFFLDKNRPDHAPDPKVVVEYFVGNQQKTVQDASSFFNWYEGIGWKTGITKISAWRGFANNWKANQVPKGNIQQVNKKDPNSFV